MIIQITPEGYIHLSGDIPVLGETYSLQECTEGTTAQLRAFHPLVQEYFYSGLHSYNCKSWLELKEFIKKDLGEGFESYIYADETGVHKVKSVNAIPDGTPLTHKLGKLKSLSKYTKKQRANILDHLISTMLQSGVNSKRFNEILEGMKQ